MEFRNAVENSTRRATSAARNPRICSHSSWHSRCASTNVAMKHAAAFALLLTIAGTPATTLACVGWCAPDAMPVSVSCHDHGAGAGGHVKNADDTCATLLAPSPFLLEETQLTRTAAPAGNPYTLSGAEGEAQRVSVHDVAPAAPHRATSSPVLRL